VLRERVLTAVVLLAVLIGVVATENAWAISVLVTLVVAAAAWEWAKLFKLSSVFTVVVAAAAWEWAKLFKLSSVFTAVFYVGIALGFGWIVQELLQWKTVFALPNFVLLSSVFWLIAAPILVILRPRIINKPMLGTIIGWIVLLGFAAGLVVLYRRFSVGFLLAALAVPIVADTAAYFVGKRFGKNKLAPQVSPKKTIEGALGGLVGVAAFLGAWVVFQNYGLWWIGVFIVLAVYSIVGDLFESLLKRQAEVKDSSNLLPGHGGVLDRIDAQLPVIPLTALAVQWIPWQ
jgi:phosphatidate cytidylyltransferase